MSGISPEMMAFAALYTGMSDLDRRQSARRGRRHHGAPCHRSAPANSRSARPEAVTRPLPPRCMAIPVKGSQHQITAAELPSHLADQHQSEPDQGNSRDRVEAREVEAAVTGR